MNTNSPPLNDTVNSTPGLSQDERDMIGGYMKMSKDALIYGLPFVIVPGLVGNLLCILTLRRKQFANNEVALLLILLAAVDLFVLSFMGISLLTYAMNVLVFSTALCQFGNYLVTVFGDVSVWLLVLITAERVVIVMWPMQHKERVTRKMLLVAVMVILLSSMALRLPDAVYMRSTDRSDNTTDTGCFNDSEGTSADYLRWSGFVVRFLLPFLLILTGNIQLIVKLVLQNRASNRLTGKGKRVGGITMMLMAASLLFLITVSPHEIRKVFTEQLFPGWRKDPIIYAKNNFVIHCTYILAFTNHTLNFFIYFISGTKFREAVKDLFAC